MRNMLGKITIIGVGKKRVDGGYSEVRESVQFARVQFEKLRSKNLKMPMSLFHL